MGCNKLKEVRFVEGRRVFLYFEPAQGSIRYQRIVHVHVQPCSE